MSHLSVVAAGLDDTTVAFLRANGMIVDRQDIDGPEELPDWLRGGAYDAGVIELERSRLGIYAARPLRLAKITTPLVGVSAGGSGEVRLRPLGPGQYSFMGEFHADTAHGVIVVE